MRTKLAHTLMAALLCLVAAESSAATFEYNVGPFDGATDPPFSISNAFLRFESGHNAYWQPSTPGVFGEVIFKIETPEAIDTATLRAPLWAYLAFDSQAEVYLDVSTDNSTWTNLVETDPTLPGPEYTHQDTIDITSIVQGSTTVYARARLYSAVYGTRGSLGVPQFLRAASVVEVTDPEYYQPLRFNAELVPEPSSFFLVTIGLFALTGVSRCRRR